MDLSSPNPPLSFISFISPATQRKPTRRAALRRVDPQGIEATGPRTDRTSWGAGGEVLLALLAWRGFYKESDMHFRFPQLHVL